MNEPDDEFEQHYALRPNKSQIKRDNAALEKLGEELIFLPKERLAKLDLPDALLEAIRLAQTIEKHHGAFKRQRKFIAKLLRDVDIGPIRGQLDGDSRQQAIAIHFTHQIERWRDRLLAGGDSEVNALMAEHPEADRQKLRQLLRDANREREAELAPRSARLLFKYLRELLAVDVEEPDEEESLED